MENNGKVVIFIQEDLGVGGIETYTYKSLKQLSARGIKGILLCGKLGYIAEAFQDIYNDPNILIWKEKLQIDKLKQMTENCEDAQITLVSFFMNGFVLAEEFKEKCDWCRVETFLFVNHYTDYINIPETAFRMPIRRIVKKRFENIFSNMNENDNICYFSKRHLTVMQENYNYQINRNIEEVLVPSVRFVVDFDQNRVEHIYERNEFKILAPLRFDFPHKGFIIGLIKTYGELKENYPNLQLIIVGSGNDEDQVLKAIQELPESAQKDISLNASCSPEELNEYYLDASLNIGIAGCFTTGASLGVLSLPARNYCMDCETYGFPPDSVNSSVSTEHGEPIKDYIIRTLNMSKQEYIQRSKDCYDTYKVDKDIILIENIQNKSDITLNVKDRKFVNKVFRYIRFKIRFNYRKQALKNDGLLKTIKHFYDKRIKKWKMNH